MQLNGSQTPRVLQATQEEADQFEFFAQHLERPLTKANMDAITVLIEVGQQKNKKRGKLTKG